MDRDELHDIYRGWRAIADSYAEPRVLVGEVWLPDAERFARYLRPGRAAHRVQLRLPGLPVGARRAARVDRRDARRARPGRRARDLGALEPRRDAAGHALRARGHVVRVRREARRHARPTSSSAPRRARAAALLTMALPGSLYVYQGEELGLPEVEDIPPERLQDPMWLRSGGVDPGRDGCRVPLPWAGTQPPFGFSPRRRREPPWLDQPDDWARADASRRRPTTRLDARALPRRPAHPPQRARLGDGALSAGSPPTRRRPRVRARRRASPVSSTSARSRSQLPAGRRRPHRQRRARRRCAPADTTVWLRAARTALRIRPDRPPERTRRKVTIGIRHDLVLRRRGDEVHSYGRIVAVVAASLLGRRAPARPTGRATHAKTVTISVASLIPRQHAPQAIKQFNAQVKRVREGEPGIKSSRSSTSGPAPTFAAKLAAGTLPTVFEVPFTDARTLGENGQLADLDRRVKALPYYTKYNRGHRGGHDAKGTIIALPKAAYAQALHYNRKLFTQAGPRPEQAADDVGADPRGRARSSPRRPARPATPRWPGRQHRPAGS